MKDGGYDTKESAEDTVAAIKKPGSDAFAIRRASGPQAFYALDPNSFVKLNGEKCTATFFLDQLRERTHPCRARSFGSQ